MSYRVRLFASIVCTVLLVVAIVMAVAWVRVLDVELLRLTDGLCNEASRVAHERYPAHAWDSLEADIVRKLRLGERHNVAIRFEDRTTGVDARSTQWDRVVAPSAVTAMVPPEIRDAPKDRSAPPSPAPRCSVSGFRHEDRDWHLAQAVTDGSTGWVAANLEAPAAEIRTQLIDGLRVVVPLVILLAGLAAWVLTIYLARPIQRIRNSMKSVTPQELDKRVESRGEDREFRELIASYNTMLERLERSFHQASRFSADAAHELKTPLTVLRGRIEQLRRTITDPALHAKLSSLIDEVSRLAAITRKLLLLSQADAGLLELHRVDVDVSTMLRELMADVELATESKTIRFEVADQLVTRGDAVLLQQMFNNLVGNALRYANEAGNVTVQARRTDGQLEVCISNSCEAISEDQRSRFFQRFYRGEDAQSRGIEGSGLGLSLALEIAQAHQGSIALQPSAPTLVQMVVSLPAA